MKRIYILISVFLILLVVASYILLIEHPGIFRSSKNEFAIEDTSKIRLIEIRSPDQIIILEKLDGKWMINRRFTASTTRINGLLMIISRLSLYAVPPDSIRDQIMKRLKDNGQRLMVLTNRRNPHVIYMYHDTVYTDATYMMKEKSGLAYRMKIPGFRNTNLASLFVPEINYWRDHILFRLRQDEIKSVSYSDRNEPENSFYLINNAPGDYQLFTNPDSIEVPGFDKESIERYLGYFTSVTFERFFSFKDDVTSLFPGYPEADQVLTVHDSRDSKTEIQTFRKYIVNSLGIRETDYNQLFAVINNTDTVIIKYVELDPVIKEIGYFIHREKK